MTDDHVRMRQYGGDLRVSVGDQFLGLAGTCHIGAGELVIAGAGPGASAGISYGDRYTAIPWSAGILAAAW
jgi:hypothetical protein